MVVPNFGFLEGSKFEACHRSGDTLGCKLEIAGHDWAVLIEVSDTVKPKGISSLSVNLFHSSKYWVLDMGNENRTKNRIQN